MNCFNRIVLAVFVTTALLASGVKAEKPQIDCTKIRGVCYGITPEEQARRELAYGSRFGSGSAPGLFKARATSTFSRLSRSFAFAIPAGTSPCRFSLTGTCLIR